MFFPDTFGLFPHPRMRIPRSSQIMNVSGHPGGDEVPQSASWGGSRGELVPRYTPLKINMEHNHGGLEDHFPF